MALADNQGPHTNRATADLDKDHIQLASVQANDSQVSPGKMCAGIWVVWFGHTESGHVQHTKGSGETLGP